MLQHIIHDILGASETSEVRVFLLRDAMERGADVVSGVCGAPDGAYTTHVLKDTTYIAHYIMVHHTLGSLVCGNAVCGSPWSCELVV